MPKINTTNIDNLEKKIKKNLNIDMDAKNENLEDKINDFKSSFKNVSNNSIIEFMNKNMFEMADKTISFNGNKIDQRRYVQTMLEKSDWDKLYANEKARMDRYSEYDIIYSYIPELASCIDMYRDSIISPDDLTKNVLPVKGKDGLLSEQDEDLLADNIELLKDKYNLSQFQRQIIGETLKYGDQFVAVLRYEDEFERYLLKEENDQIMPPEFLNINERLDQLNEEENNTIFNEEFYHDSLFENLQEIITEDVKQQNKIKASLGEPKEDANKIYDKVVNNIKNVIDGIKTKNGRDIAQASRKNRVGRSKSMRHFDETFKGSIIRVLEPQYTIKLQVDNCNFGYLYAELEARKKQLKNDQNTLVKDFFASRTNIEANLEKQSREEIITNIFAKGIAKKLDIGFIEDNKEFKDLIYVLLKNKKFENETVSFVYFTPEEVTHFAVDVDKIYGKSRMANSLFAAKLYISSVLNELMQKLTRGRDKRVVYTEIGLDEAAEEAIQTVIRDIKSKEIQTDNLKSLTTLLRTVGNFEDYYIPVFDGEKNIEFDTIQGINEIGPH